MDKIPTRLGGGIWYNVVSENCCESGPGLDSGRSCRGDQFGRALPERYLGMGRGINLEHQAELLEKMRHIWKCFLVS